MAYRHAVLLVVFWASAKSQLTDEYAAIEDLDYCGQSCSSSCEEAEDEYAVCRCDSECERYGDCCSPPSGRLNCTGGEQRVQPLAGLQCRSIRLDSRTQPGRMEAFWMVSTCPEDWPANQDDEILKEVDDKCVNGSDTLPPVTDLDGGVVYKNEYCAVCHQVANIQPWGYRFGCSQCFEDRIATQSINVTQDMINKECVACGFHVPQTGPPPRHCLHNSLVVDECLTREVLEEETGLRWEEEVYSDIMGQCQTGPLRPVLTSASPCTSIFYKNQYCALCSAEKTANLACAVPYASSIDFCLSEADNLCYYYPPTIEFFVPEEEVYIISGSGDFYWNDDEFEEQSSEQDTLGSGVQPDDLRKRQAVPGDPEPQVSGSGSTTEADGVAVSGLQSNEYFGSGYFDSGEYVLPVILCGGPWPIQHTSFTLFIDVKGDSGVITSDTIASTLTIFCPKGQVFDPINEACRETLCPEGFATIRVSCAIVQNISLPEPHNSSNDSLIMCDEGIIVLQESEFKLLDNNTLLFHNDTFEIVSYNGSSPIICSNFTQNESVSHNVTVLNYTYPPIFFVLTYVCCSLSVVGCVVVLLTYSLFKELRTLPGQILMNLVSTILATCLFLLVGIPVAVLTEKDEPCEATAIFLHWLILSQFSWMSIMNFELLRTFYRASHFHPVEGKSTKRKMLLLYLLIGWGIPILIAFTVVLVNFTTDVIQYGRDGFCWIGHVPSFYVVFVAPVALSIVFNGIAFVITFTLLFKASIAQAKLKQQQQQSFSYLRVSLCAFSITGLTWIFGFLAILIGHDWAWYAFIILTSTQGLVICTAFIFTKKIADLYKHFFFSLLACSNSSSTKPKQEISLVQYVGKIGNANRVPAKSAPTRDAAKSAEVVIQNTRGMKNGGQVAIKMDLQKRPQPWRKK